MTLSILDLDDTLANTSQEMQGSWKNIHKLTLVPGARTFLNRHGTRSVLVTVGNPEVQRRKLKLLGIADSLRGVHIISENECGAYQQKRHVIEKIVRTESAPIVVIGDRIDAEIRIGNELCCKTVRVRLPNGKHTREQPQDKLECAHLVVTSFCELLEQFSNVCTTDSP